MGQEAQSVNETVQSSACERDEAFAYIRDKINQLLGVMGTLPLKPEELDDTTLLALDPLGIIADSFQQVIDHQHETNTALGVARDELAAIVDAAGASIVVIDDKLVIHEFNQLARETLFHQGGDPLGQVICDLIGMPGESAPQMRLREIITQGRAAEDIDIELGPRTFHVTVSPLTENKAICVFFDVTERSRTERRLRESQALLSEAQRIANLGNWELDLVTQNATWSEEEYRLLGYEPGSVDASLDNFMNVVHPDDMEGLQSQMQAAMHPEGNGEYSVSHRVVRPDGGVRHVREQGRVTFDAEGKPLRMFGTTLDITDQVEAEKRLNRMNEELEERVRRRTVELETAKHEAEEANKAKTDFLAHMSHELRTPLNAIIGFAEFLKYAPESMSGKQQQYTNHIVDSGRHLLGLINDVLDLAKIESGELQVEYEEISLSSLIDDCLQLIDAQAKERSLTVGVACHCGASPIVRADPRRLRQVLINILSNAVKYNRDEGEIEVWCDNDGQGVARLYVRNTGVGIPEAFHQAVFERFARDSTTAKLTEGHGIGLSISKDLMRMMGGDIAFESTPDVGATFWIDIPLASA